MAHPQQQDFCKKIKEIFPNHFNGKKVLDIGSLDVNGNNRFLFENCNYIGLDVGEGPNVDVSCPGHIYDAPSDQFDIIISTEVFEHDMHYRETVKNIIRMLKPGGAFIFTCASGQRPEHGTRRRGEHNAPLLIQQSEEWADYYKNLEEEHFLEIEGFREAFPDGIFEYGCHGVYNHEWVDPTMHNIHADIYFFGIKGGIRNTERFTKKQYTPILKETNEFSNDIFIIDAWPDTQDKENDLIDCINRLRSFTGIEILLVSHYPIIPEIQKMVDYYIFDKDNPLLLNSEFAEYGVSSGRWTNAINYRVENSVSYHHDYAIWKSMANAFNFCKFLGKTNIHFLEYDNLINPIQYKQSFLDQSRIYDAVIYEYTEGSSIDAHLAQYIATYIFSIKTEVAVKLISKINSKKEYFLDKPEGWQLERVFFKALKECTHKIGYSKYIANDNELNTKAVWNRDGILRDDARFQIYPAVDGSGMLYLHLISGFHETPADKDYLIEIRYMDLIIFKTLTVDNYELIELGAYRKGHTITVNYLGKTIFTEFLELEVSDYIKINKVTLATPISRPTVFYNFVNGAYVEIKSESLLKYRVSFIDSTTGISQYSAEIGNNNWAKSAIQYYKEWKIEIADQLGTLLETINFDITGKKIYIALDSRSLGDTLAWFPYVEEFRKVHNCEVVCSTFWNSFFIKTYPQIQFVSPGSNVTGIYGMYTIGWYNNGNDFDPTKNPRDFKLGPLQRTASDILGLEYKELKPLIEFPTRSTNSKKVALGIHSTAQSKYWNNPNGWQTVVDWLNENGYEPVILSKEADGYMNNYYPSGATIFPEGPIDKVIAELTQCAAFIGISSGLTWLAWATDTPTLQISGFTEQFNEPDSGIVKVSAPVNACSGCANRIKFDPSDWNWCPDHKGTSRQFECSKLITADMVISKLKQILI